MSATTVTLILLGLVLAYLGWRLVDRKKREKAKSLGATWKPPAEQPLETLLAGSPAVPPPTPPAARPVRVGERRVRKDRRKK